MDIRHLEYFVEVARQKNFSRAAEILCVSQSAISKMIKDMELELGLQLFRRNSKSVQLTDIGEIFFDRAQQTLLSFHNLITEVAKESKLEKGKIAIGLPPITGATSFAKLLGEFKKRYPLIDISLYEYGSKKIELGIQDGSLDVGITCNLENMELYHSFSLSNDPLSVIVHPQNPISSCSEIDLAALKNESFVIYRDDFSLHQLIVSQCNIAGFHPKIILETSQRELMTQIVAANLGIALLPSKTCAELDPSYIVTLQLTAPRLFHQMSVIWKKERYLSHTTQLWLQFARSYLARDLA